MHQRCEDTIQFIQKEKKKCAGVREKNVSILDILFMPTVSIHRYLYIFDNFS